MGRTGTGGHVTGGAVGVADVRRDPNRAARRLFAGLPARYDVLAAVLSLGQDRRWRRAAVDAALGRQPGTVLDVATGPAGVALQVAERSPATVVGLDLTEAMLRRGAANVRRVGRQGRVHLVLARGEQLPFPDRSFDALTFSYLLRYVADPAATLAELARVVRPGGTVASLEFSVPARQPWRALWHLYTGAVLPVAGLALGGREWWQVGRFLGPSITDHVRRHPPAWLRGAWEAAGLTDVHLRPMSVGGGLVMWGTKRA